jgi:SAM-dependent methyltransferase
VGFSDVDRSDGAERLAAYLRTAHAGLAAMKSYMAAAAKRAVGDGTVLDVGCGLGFDLDRLEGLGLDAVGVDFSVEMLRRAESAARLACADGAALPFRDAAFAGCRIERVLQHVADPAAVMAEVARVVRGGGFLSVFEPDYGTFRVESDVVPDGSLPASQVTARHPRIGSRLADLAEAHGFIVDDVVTESSRGYRLDRLPIDAVQAVERAVRSGAAERAFVDRWLDEQRARTAAGTFRARWDKIVLIATRRGER